MGGSLVPKGDMDKAKQTSLSNTSWTQLAASCDLLGIDESWLSYQCGRKEPVPHAFMAEQLLASLLAANPKLVIVVHVEASEPVIKASQRAPGGARFKQRAASADASYGQLLAESLAAGKSDAAAAHIVSGRAVGVTKRREALAVALDRFVQDGRLVFMASLGENDLNAPPALKEFAGLLGVAVGRTGYAANDFDLLLLDCPMKMVRLRQRIGPTDILAGRTDDVVEILDVPGMQAKFFWSPAAANSSSSSTSSGSSSTGGSGSSTSTSSGDTIASGVAVELSRVVPHTLLSLLSGDYGVRLLLPRGKGETTVWKHAKLAYEAVLSTPAYHQQPASVFVSLLLHNLLSDAEVRMRVHLAVLTVMLTLATQPVVVPTSLDGGARVQQVQLLSAAAVQDLWAAWASISAAAGPAVQLQLQLRQDPSLMQLSAADLNSVDLYQRCSFWNDSITAQDIAARFLRGELLTAGVVVIDLEDAMRMGDEGAASQRAEGLLWRLQAYKQQQEQQQQRWQQQHHTQPQHLPHHAQLQQPEADVNMEQPTDDVVAAAAAVTPVIEAVEQPEAAQQQYVEFRLDVHPGRLLLSDGAVNGIRCAQLLGLSKPAPRSTPGSISGCISIYSSGSAPQLLCVLDATWQLTGSRLQPLWVVEGWEYVQRSLVQLVPLCDMPDAYVRLQQLGSSEVSNAISDGSCSGTGSKRRAVDSLSPAFQQGVWLKNKKSNVSSSSSSSSSSHGGGGGECGGGESSSSSSSDSGAGLVRGSSSSGSRTSIETDSFVTTNVTLQLLIRGKQVPYMAKDLAAAVVDARMIEVMSRPAAAAVVRVPLLPQPSGLLYLSSTQWQALGLADGPQQLSAQPELAALWQREGGGEYTLVGVLGVGEQRFTGFFRLGAQIKQQCAVSRLLDFMSLPGQQPPARDKSMLLSGFSGGSSSSSGACSVFDSGSSSSSSSSSNGSNGSTSGMQLAMQHVREAHLQQHLMGRLSAVRSGGLLVDMAAYIHRSTGQLDGLITHFVVEVVDAAGDVTPLGAASLAAHRYGLTQNSNGREQGKGKHEVVIRLSGNSVFPDKPDAERATWGTFSDIALPAAFCMTAGIKQLSRLDNVVYAVLICGSGSSSCTNTTTSSSPTSSSSRSGTTTSTTSTTTNSSSSSSVSSRNSSVAVLAVLPLTRGNSQQPVVGRVVTTARGSPSIISQATNARCVLMHAAVRFARTQRQPSKKHQYAAVPRHTLPAAMPPRTSSSRFLETADAELEDMRATVHCTLGAFSCEAAPDAAAAARADPVVQQHMQRMGLPLERVRAVPLSVTLTVSLHDADGSSVTHEVDVQQQLQRGGS